MRYFNLHIAVFFYFSALTTLLMNGNTHVKASQTSLSITPRMSHSDSAQRWLAAFLVTAIGCTLLIMQSLKAGALALPPVYDDISYFDDAARRLVLLYQTGIRELIENTMAGPPHAPLSTALAFIGFAIFGMAPWAAVAANAILLFFFVRLFFAVAASIPVGQATLLAIAILAAPLFGITVLEFRPDMFCGLFVAIGVVAIIAQPWVDSRRNQTIAGLVFAAALWAKPTVFPLTTALFLAAMFLSSLPWFVRHEWKRPVLAGLFTVVVTLILASPYYILAWHHVVDYIWTTVFGSEAAIWVKPLPFRDSIRFYLTGPTGQVSLGKWLYIGVAIAALASALIWIKRQRTLAITALLLAVMVLIVYVAVTIPPFKGPHGLPFAAVFLCVIAVAMVRIAILLPRWASWAFCVAIAMASLLQFQWPYSRLKGPVDAKYAATRWAMVRETFAALGPNVGGKTILLTTSASFLNPSVLELEYFSRGLTPPQGIDIQRRADVDEHRRNIEQADIIFAVTPDFKEVFPNLPTASPEFRAKVIELVDTSHMFEKAVRIPDPVGGGAVLIYQRRGTSLQSFVSSENLGAIEGPYPKWSLPQVRWGWGSESKLHISGTPGAKAELVIQARTVPVVNQTLSVLVNNEEKLIPTAMTYGFQGFTIPFVYNNQGKADIELRYGISAPQAVLYKALYVREQPNGL